MEQVRVVVIPSGVSMKLLGSTIDQIHGLIFPSFFLFRELTIIFKVQNNIKMFYYIVYHYSLYDTVAKITGT